MKFQVKKIEIDRKNGIITAKFNRLQNLREDMPEHPVPYGMSLPLSLIPESDTIVKDEPVNVVESILWELCQYTGPVSDKISNPVGMTILGKGDLNMRFDRATKKGDTQRINLFSIEPIAGRENNGYFVTEKQTLEILAILQELNEVVFEVFVMSKFAPVPEMVSEMEDLNK